MKRQNIMLLNLIPYALLSVFGAMGLLLDCFLGKSYSFLATNLLWSYFVFPVVVG